MIACGGALKGKREVNMRKMFRGDFLWGKIRAIIEKKRRMRQIWRGRWFVVAMLWVGVMVAGLSGENSFAKTVRLGDMVPSGNAKVRVTKQVTRVTNPLNEKFVYGVAEGSGNPAAIGDMVTSFNIDFVRVVPDSRSVATVVKEVDLSQLTFSRVGTYRIVIRERTSNRPIMTPKDEEKYTVVITVKNANNGTGEWVAEVADLGIRESDGVKAEMIFTTEQRMTYIEISKEVAGGMGDTEEYFKIKVDIQVENGGDRYVITGQDSFVEYRGETVATQAEYIAGQTNYVYLKHGQTVKIGKREDGLSQVPIMFTYTVWEMDAEEYETAIDSGTWHERNGKVVDKTTFGEPMTPEEEATAESFAMGNRTRFLNRKDEIVETGLGAVVGPFLVMAMVAVVGALAVGKIGRLGI